MIELTDFSKNSFEKVKSIIKDMGKSKLIFQSEAQFQHILAMRLEKEIAENEDLKIYLEAYTNDYTYECTGKTKRCYTDIVILDNKNMRYIAIELKYKTQEFSCTLNKFKFDLKPHHAIDNGCYDFLWDLNRIEDLTINSSGNMKKYKCIAGCAVFITNDNRYWTSHASDSSARYKMFFLGDGDIIEKTELKWNKKDDDKDSRHNTRIILKGVKESKFEWQDYCEFDPEQENNIFKYLFLTV